MSPVSRVAPEVSKPKLRRKGRLALAVAASASGLLAIPAGSQPPREPVPTDIRPAPQGEENKGPPAPTAGSAGNVEASPSKVLLVPIIAPAGGWTKTFRRFVEDPGPEPSRPSGCDRGTDYLDQAWLATCFGPGAAMIVEDSVHGASLRLSGDDALLYAGVERANVAFFEEGYVNSGILVSVDTGNSSGFALKVVSGSLGRIRNNAFEECRIDKAVRSESLHRYAERRMMRGCRNGRPFNLYLLERDFRRLADDGERWVSQVGYRVEPIPAEPGLAKLQALDNAADPVAAPKAGRASRDAMEAPQPIEARPLVSMVAGVANDRSPSIGSVRGYAAATLRWPAGFLFAAEVGRTEGGLDGSATARAALTPRWSGEIRGDANQAEIVDPLLRPLDIRSRGWGIEGAVLFGAISCPLTPLFAATQTGAPRRASSRGFERCRLAGRFLGDVPIDWSPARELEFGLSVSHRESRSFLFGEPFSFAPGAVDGRSHVTALRGTINWLQRGRAGVGGARGWTFAARLQASFGLDGSASDIAGLAAPPRHFAVVRAEAGYARQLRFGRLVVTGRLSGQWTGDLLYTSERLPVGGVNSVRGYPEAALLADRGVIGSVEISRLVSLTGRRPVQSPATDDPGQVRLSLFADGAVASSLNPNARFDETLGSVGAGIAWLPRPWIELSAQYGLRLGGDLAGPGSALANDGIHFGLRIWPLRLLGLEGD